ICYDDSGPSHPSVTIVPTLLSVGDWRHLSGKEILTAQVLAYDVFQRLNSATREAWEMRKRGWHPTGFFGAVTSAAICAKLLGFNLDKSVQAVSIASTMGGGLSQSIGNMGMGLHAGTACRNGINAAGLAEHGFICDADPLTGRFGLLDALCGPGEYDADALTRDLGKPFRVLEPGISIKPYPNCWAHHKVYDSVMKLKHQYAIDPDMVEAIYVDLQTDKPTYRYTRPKTDLEARYSVGYGIAMILLEGKLDLEQYEPECIQAEPTIRLMEKIIDTPAVGDEQQRITIVMKDGRRYSDLRTWSKGHPHLEPLTDVELKAKYDRCAACTLGAERVKQTYDVISHLEELENVSELMDLLVP
ncbi:MmgE/PrpD family protein, partial [Enterocloster asparagiformis]|uniref:MmgE/PrpD family protein n=1 Tax=Enterocloster asparagiformis TaxID=333367 RepID=UPI002A8326F6